MTEYDSKAAIERIEAKLDRFETVEKKLDRIDTALYGTGNPHGGLFQQFAALDGKVSTLSSEIKGVEKTLTAKIDGVESKLKAKIDGIGDKFNEMFRFAKWTSVDWLGRSLRCSLSLPCRFFLKSSGRLSKSG